MSISARTLWSALCALIVGAALLSVSSSAPAGAPPSTVCCACICNGAVTACTDTFAENCPSICAQQPSGACGFDFLNSSTGTCATAPQCDAARGNIPAPLFGASGLAIAMAVLSGFGILGIRRRRRD